MSRQVTITINNVFDYSTPVNNISQDIYSGTTVSNINTLIASGFTDPSITLIIDDSYIDTFIYIRITSEDCNNDLIYQIRVKDTLVSATILGSSELIGNVLQPFTLNTYAESIDVTLDCKIIFHGAFNTYGGQPSHGLLVIDKCGNYDTVFMNNFEPGLPSISAWQEEGVFVDHEGFIWVSGSLTGLKGRVKKYFPDGTIDGSFDDGVGFNNYSSKPYVDLDGYIYIGGLFSSYNGTTRQKVIKLNPDGTVNTTFDGGTGPNNSVSAVRPAGNGQIWVHGYFTTWNDITCGHIVLLDMITGARDFTFNPGTGPNQAGSPGTEPIRMAPDGENLICTSAYNNNSYNGVGCANNIYKVNRDGTLNTDFNSNAGSGFDGVVDDIINDNGKFLITGRFSNYNGVPVKRMIRLNNDGTLDNTFDLNLDVSDNVMWRVTKMGDYYYTTIYEELNGTWILYPLKVSMDGSSAEVMMNLSECNSELNICYKKISGDVYGVSIVTGTIIDKPHLLIEGIIDGQTTILSTLYSIVGIESSSQGSSSILGTLIGITQISGTTNGLTFIISDLTEGIPHTLISGSSNPTTGYYSRNTYGSTASIYFSNTHSRVGNIFFTNFLSINSVIYKLRKNGNPNFSYKASVYLLNGSNLPTGNPILNSIESYTTTTPMTVGVWYDIKFTFPTNTINVPCAVIIEMFNVVYSNSSNAMYLQNSTLNESTIHKYTYSTNTTVPAIWTSNTNNSIAHVNIDYINLGTLIGKKALVGETFGGSTVNGVLNRSLIEGVSNPITGIIHNVTPTTSNLYKVYYDYSIDGSRQGVIIKNPQSKIETFSFLIIKGGSPNFTFQAEIYDMPGGTINSGAPLYTSNETYSTDDLLSSTIYSPKWFEASFTFPENTLNEQCAILIKMISHTNSDSNNYIGLPYNYSNSIATEISQVYRRFSNTSWGLGSYTPMCILNKNNLDLGVLTGLKTVQISGVSNSVASVELAPTYLVDLLPCDVLILGDDWNRSDGSPQLGIYRPSLDQTIYIRDWKSPAIGYGSSNIARSQNKVWFGTEYDQFIHEYDITNYPFSITYSKTIDMEASFFTYETLDPYVYRSQLEVEFEFGWSISALDDRTLICSNMGGIDGIYQRHIIYEVNLDTNVWTKRITLPPSPNPANYDGWMATGNWTLTEAEPRKFISIIRDWDYWHDYIMQWDWNTGVLEFKFNIQRNIPSWQDIGDGGWGQWQAMAVQGNYIYVFEQSTDHTEIYQTYRAVTRFDMNTLGYKTMKPMLEMQNINGAATLYNAGAGCEALAINTYPDGNLRGVSNSFAQTQWSFLKQLNTTSIITVNAQVEDCNEGNTYVLPTNETVSAYDNSHFEGQRWVTGLDDWDGINEIFLDVRTYTKTYNPTTGYPITSPPQITSQNGGDISYSILSSIDPRITSSHRLQYIRFGSDIRDILVVRIYLPDCVVSNLKSLSVNYATTSGNISFTGSGINPIEGHSFGSSLIESRMNPIVFVDNTYLDVYIDTSGSMNQIIQNLTEAVTENLKTSLLSYYGNDVNNYNAHVRVFQRSHERALYMMNGENTVSTENRVVLLFENEAQSVYHQSLNSYDVYSEPQGQLVADIGSLKSRLDVALPDTYKTMSIQVSGHEGYKTLLRGIQYNSGSFETLGLKNYPQVKWKYDISPGETASYYNNLILDILTNDFNFII